MSSRRCRRPRRRYNTFARNQFLASLFDDTLWARLTGVVINVITYCSGAGEVLIGYINVAIVLALYVAVRGRLLPLARVLTVLPWMISALAFVFRSVQVRADVGPRPVLSKCSAALHARAL